MDIRPISFKFANRYVRENHRHNTPVQGCKFCIGVFEGTSCHGVAICGRPVSRNLDNGLTLEINRVCTDGTRNACSMLYGASARVAKAMGYHKVITYTLESENGASLKASNFVNEGLNSGGSWHGRTFDTSQDLFPDMPREVPTERKQRWSITFVKD